MHYIGFSVVFRRMLDLPDHSNTWNMVSSLGTVSLTFYILLFRINCQKTCILYRKLSFYQDFVILGQMDILQSLDNPSYTTYLCRLAL